MDIEESIPWFLEVTGTDNVEVARQYLQMANGATDRAIDLYFDHAAGGGTSHLPRPPVDDVDEDPTNPAPMNNIDADEIYARQLQAEMEAQVNTVREADQMYSDRLIGGYGDRSAIDDLSRANHFTGFSSVPGDDDKRGLVHLFSPPDYRFEGDLTDAKHYAAANEKLLLISFNDTSDFRSHILNRDVWKKDEVTVFMKAFFVLLQVEAKLNEGIAERYKITDIPSIILVDPRTGRKLKSISFDQFRNEATASDTLTEIVSDYPIDVIFRKQPEVPERSEGRTTTLESQSDADRTRSDVGGFGALTDRSTATPASTTYAGDSIETTVKAEVAVVEKDEVTAKAVEDHYNQTNSTLAELNAARRRRMEQDREQK